VRVSTLLNRLLNLQGLRVTGVLLHDGELVVTVHRRFQVLTCPCCGAKKRGRMSSRIRRWRHLGLWGRPVWIEGEIRRMRCRGCQRVVTEDVPWARHDSDFTKPFEEAVGLLAQKTDKTTVAKLCGIAWVTVGNIAQRLVKELLAPTRLQGLRRLAVDEISFRKHHRYLTVVTDHDRRQVVWVAEGKSSEVLKSFFHDLGPAACAEIEIVTMDMSAAYAKAVSEALPNAQIAYDHFHIAKLANEALNEVRRELVRELRPEDPAAAKAVKSLRWPTLHRLANVPDKHLDALANLRPDQPLGRAYLLKEDLLDALSCSAELDRPDGRLSKWLDWASRSRLAPFVKLGRTLREHLAGIRAFLEHRVTNGLAEGVNNKIRLLSHRAFGFHSAAPLIATIYLCCGGITLPELHLL
jgi:transposase